MGAAGQQPLRWPALAPRAMMPVEVDIAWNMRVDNLDLDRPAAEQPRPPPPLSSMRQSIEATRSNPAVQAAMIDRPSQGRGLCVRLCLCVFVCVLSRGCLVCRPSDLRVCRVGTPPAR